MANGKKYNICVVGCGRWGSCIAWYLDTIGHNVTLYGKDDAPEMIRFINERKNDLLELGDRITLSTDITCLVSADIIVISIPSQALRGFMREIQPLELKGKTFVLCMKGIEIGSCMRLSEIAEEGVGADNKVAVWIGPGHVQEFYRGIPNCMVIDSTDPELKKQLVDDFSSKLIRFYYGTDIIGNEVGAASKNVIGIAAGMLDGFGLSSLKGALMSRGTHEISNLIVAMGGSALSAYGLCHLGDYEATVFSKYSHNRMFGERFIKGEKYESLAEGYYTVKALIELSEKYQVELPICKAVYDVLYLSADPKNTLDGLFSRSIKNEQ